MRIEAHMIGTSDGRIFAWSPVGDTRCCCEYPKEKYALGIMDNTTFDPVWHELDTDTLAGFILYVEDLCDGTH